MLEAKYFLSWRRFWVFNVGQLFFFFGVGAWLVFSALEMEVSQKTEPPPPLLDQFGYQKGHPSRPLL